MNIDSFFLKKHYNEILETIVADQKNVTYTHIDLAKKSLWYPGISIVQYILLLRCWKILLKFVKLYPYHEIVNDINNLKDLNELERKIFLFIVENWHKTRLLYYSLDDNIQNFKDNKININVFINNFIKKKNPLRSQE